jgi:hypothetical protein
VLNIKRNAQTQVFSANLSRRFQKLMEKVVADLVPRG